MIGDNLKIWKYAFASIMVTISVQGFGRMSYGILMPFMKKSLSLTYAQAGLLGTATSIGYLGMVLFAGILASKWGSKKLVILGTLLVAFGLFFISMIQSYLACLAGMALLGIGTAFAYTPLVNIVVGWFPKHRGLMIGFLLCGLGLGTVISSLFIPYFTAWFSNNGWRILWILYGIISLLSVVCAYFILRDPPVPLRKKAQKSGSLIREVYLHKGVLTVAIIYGLIGFAYLIPQSFLFSFMLEANLDRYSAGRIMALGGFISIFSGPIWGAVSDKIGRKKSLLITLFIGAVSMVFPVIYPEYIGFGISQILWGSTIVGMLSLILALSTEQIHQSYAPIALGYATVFFAVGQLAGPGLGGWMIDHMGGIPSALLLCCGLLLLGFILSMQLKKDVVNEQAALEKNRWNVNSK
ncbi:YbfB/YjiJ family MFS transporter [Peribacillus huizhouensis]|uniref:MFS family permease n=1 Tax=Peribacillus huizhouensis TaxID=1501239 RepID=A0ABR6CTF8_9BACI|nr:YbfB/YjiJ family MFS transporter [Peribacillus huizhouensis]MBA9028250.1 MFS family permease [Peribacillus huizhouensis]